MANSRNYSTLDGKLNVTGKLINQYREKLNLSRQVLSDKLIMIGIDIPANSIYDIEAGTRTVVDFEVCAIAKIFKIPVEYLLNDYYNSLENV